ncbi:YqgQ family protein [Bacillus salitolerans]|uniref:YqgQ family protein n=1 Tax=Bacillus salitolerans TaxID=1437434 RepID=A0ABW4LPZ3_9BACI
MKTLYDVQQFLRRYGIFIYVGDRLADLEMMEEELRELFHSKLIEPNDFKIGQLIVRQEQENEKRKRNG